MANNELAVIQKGDIPQQQGNGWRLLLDKLLTCLLKLPPRSWFIPFATGGGDYWLLIVGN